MINYEGNSGVERSVKRRKRENKNEGAERTETGTETRVV
jgi:hypothetical protein